MVGRGMTSSTADAATNASHASSDIGSGLRAVAHRLDVVAVRADDEGGVVVRMIVRAQSRRAVVLAAGSDRGAVERVDLRVVPGGEGKVQRAGGRRGPVQPQRGMTLSA